MVLWVPSMEGRYLHVLAAGLTDVGKARHHNEDNILVRQDLGIFLVSDGMGGHNAGEVASALTIASVRNFFEATTLEDFAESDSEEIMAGARRVAAAVQKANRDVHEISTTHPKHRGMGCTLVMLYLQPPVVHIAHLGDSRCYRIRGGKIQPLTRDHTLINDILALKPDISDDDLAHLPKNIVTRAVGIEPTVQFDVLTEEFEFGDIYLLCSDGLTGMLSEPKILETITETPDPAQATTRLIQLANDAGGLDNISAVVLRLDLIEDSNLITQPLPAAPSVSAEVPAAASTPIAPAEDLVPAEPSAPPSEPVAPAPSHVS
ncbi:MAG: protein phosphatase 2C domain-containing protein [Myxococcales bacterium]|nr:protein phosphatase 2C domain-containing protein [Polyangiaceae bacterium]MDW8249533.1 protein phosphatase 2C domain-containing protein [Myxococcales bacterium]